MLAGQVGALLTGPHLHRGNHRPLCTQVFSLWHLLQSMRTVPQFRRHSGNSQAPQL